MLYCGTHCQLVKRDQNRSADLVAKHSLGEHLTGLLLQGALVFLAHQLAAHCTSNSDFLLMWDLSSIVRTTWEAILKRRRALEIGLVKRIWDGTTKHIWVDLEYLMSQGISRVRKLGELFSADSRWWNEDTLQENFLTPDIWVIKKTPLGKLDQDMWVWSRILCLSGLTCTSIPTPLWLHLQFNMQISWMLGCPWWVKYGFSLSVKLTNCFKILN